MSTLESVTPGMDDHAVTFHSGRPAVFNHVEIQIP